MSAIVAPCTSRRLTRRAAALALLAPVAGSLLATCDAAGASLHQALAGDGPWLNSPSLRPADLRGKVVLVNFWTYTCINSLRPLPYLRAWAEKYRDRGLVVIGVHTPEFTFEHDASRVRQAVADLGVSYPVVLDNDERIWQAFGNTAWPGFHFLDARGRRRHLRLGEGEYDRSERLLQKLLEDVLGQPVKDAITPVTGEGAQAAPDWEDLESPETYAGYAKAASFASLGGLRRDAPFDYQPPARLPANAWSLSGSWAVGPEFAELASGRGTIAFRFHARDLHLVMAPGLAEQVIPFRVRVDGAEPGADHGYDIAPDGRGELHEARMYQLVRQAGPVRGRTFEIEFSGPGPRAYCFTFG
jgi:thiol-disulfide isomerase/thioredoxin